MDLCSANNPLTTAELIDTIMRTSGKMKRIAESMLSDFLTHFVDGLKLVQRRNDGSRRDYFPTGFLPYLRISGRRIGTFENIPASVRKEALSRLLSSIPIPENVYTVPVWLSSPEGEINYVTLGFDASFLKQLIMETRDRPPIIEGCRETPSENFWTELQAGGTTVASVTAENHYHYQG